MLNKKIALGAVGAGLLLAAVASFSSPARAETAQLDPQAFEAAMEAYIEANPKLLLQLNENYTKVAQAEQQEMQKKLIANNAADLFGWDDAIVIGNPDGAVTMVEFFDYNCHYCRSAAPTVAGLVQDNDDLRVVLMDLPILSQGSIDAAEIGIAVAQLGGDYAAFHEQMFTIAGEANAESAMEIAEGLGLDPEEIRARVASSEVSDALQRRIDLAQAMQIAGTPAFVIGDQLVPGAAPQEALQSLIDATAAQ